MGDKDKGHEIKKRTVKAPEIQKKKPVAKQEKSKYSDQCSHGVGRDECRQCRRLSMLREFGRGLESINGKSID